MRQYDIVSGILLILSIIDFALSAPVLVQEKRQACLKRWEEGAEQLWEHFDTLVNLEGSGNLESSATHTSLSSGSSEPYHGSTNIVHAPASSIANPYPPVEPSSPSSTTLTQSSWVDHLNAVWDDVWLYKANNEFHGPLYTPTSSAYGSSGYGSDYEFTKAQAPQPNPNLRPSTDPDSTDPDIDWNYSMTSGDPPPPRPAWPNSFGKPHEYQVDLHANLPSTSGYAPSQTEPEHEVVTPPSESPNLGSQKEPTYEVVSGPSPSPELTDPEYHLDHQSLSADSQPLDLRAAIYAAKGKAKESPHISGTARDVGNAALGC